MGNMITWIIIIVLIGVVGEIIENKLFGKNESKTPENNKTIIYKQKPFMTVSETSFYQKIKPLEQQYKIVPQVNLATIIEKIADTKYQTELFRNIDYGIFANDFSKILLLIELNDPSHKQAQRKKRDIKVHEICKDANIPIITFYTNYPNEQQYVLNRIITEIQKNNNTVEVPVQNTNNLDTSERS